MEDRQDSKSKRARKRARNLVAKQSKYSGFVHKPEKIFRRKEKYPVDFESWHGFFCRDAGFLYVFLWEPPKRWLGPEKSKKRIRIL